MGNRFTQAVAPKVRRAAKSRAAMTRTENRMPTPAFTGSTVLDLFSKIGALRGKPGAEIVAMFDDAFSEDRLLALKTLFYSRDVRQGQGERRTFRAIFRAVCITRPEIANANIPNVPYFGRWDDLLVAIGTPVEENALAYIAGTLLAGAETAQGQLCAKWMPRLSSARKAEGDRLRKFMHLTPGEYRRLLVGNSDTIEQIMSGRRWADVDYNKVPSQALTRYRKAWYRNDGERYLAWLNAIEKKVPGVKVNAKTLHPHEIVGKFMKSAKQQGVYGCRQEQVAPGLHRNLYDWPHLPQDADTMLLEALWSALPNWLAGPNGQRRLLPLADVSGSMLADHAMEASVALALYLAQRNTGPFQDLVATFAGSPSFVQLEGRLGDRVRKIMEQPWGTNTNLQAVFDLLLARARAERVPANEMPEAIIILSDMQFDVAMGRVSQDTALEMISKQYAAAGYVRPTLVFWNLRASKGATARADDRDVMLVSGFSPSIMTTILSGVQAAEEIPPTPYETMIEKLNAERYDRVILA